MNRSDSAKDATEKSRENPFTMAQIAQSTVQHCEIGSQVQWTSSALSVQRLPSARIFTV